MIHVIHVLEGHLIGSDLLIRCYLPHLIKHLQLPQWQKMIRLTISTDLTGHGTAHARTLPQRPLYRSMVIPPFRTLMEKETPLHPHIKYLPWMQSLAKCSKSTETYTSSIPLSTRLAWDDINGNYGFCVASAGSQTKCSTP